MIANPDMIELFAKRDRCWMCKHKFERPVILPVDKPERGKFQPNINTEVLWHLKDTHGQVPEVVRSWILGSVYGQELTLTGAKGFGVDL